MFKLTILIICVIQPKFLENFSSFPIAKLPLFQLAVGVKTKLLKRKVSDFKLYLKKITIPDI